VWGDAAPGQAVTVTLGDASVNATAGANGEWRAELPARAAGGPLTLTARAGTREQKVTDVLVGDVWLCSGQSNMQMGVRGSINGRAEIAASANDRIRQLTIPLVSSPSLRTDFDKPLEWKIAGPETTGDFSASCYFFVRELIKTQPVAQGMIVSAWGGSKILPWLSEAAIRGLGGYDDRLAVLGKFRTDPTAAAAGWGDIWTRWWMQQPSTRGRTPWTRVRGDAADWRAAPAELTPWESWGVPELASYNGIVWYRANVKLTPSQAKQAATLSLGQVDEIDLTFVNGRAIGASACCAERNYPVPAGLLKAGDNLVVVQDLDTYMSGGMYGPAEKRALVFADGTRVPLGSWEYQVAPAELKSPPRAPWEPTAGTATIYNAMIAPLRNYSLRGAAWYQGESNGYLLEARQYQRELAALMADWRRQFEAPLPFLIVQLPDYGPTTSRPVESAWALLRDAQRRAAAADRNAALVVTIDIGNREDVHPTNKQEVGRRLARAARHLVYGEKLSASGAQPAGARVNGSSVEVQFADFAGDLVAYSSRDPSAFELCGPEEGSCQFVTAHLAGNGRVTLESAPVPRPTRVRYCWADSPLCNLFDGDGLPVGPFEIAVSN
jgi:sialate O-acetylesterase